MKFIYSYVISCLMLRGSSQLQCGKAYGEQEQSITLQGPPGKAGPPGTVNVQKLTEEIMEQIKAEFAAIRQENKNDIRTLRIELKADMNELRADLQDVKEAIRTLNVTAEKIRGAVEKNKRKIRSEMKEELEKMRTEVELNLTRISLDIAEDKDRPAQDSGDTAKLLEMIQAVREDFDTKQEEFRQEIRGISERMQDLEAGQPTTTAVTATPSLATQKLNWVIAGGNLQYLVVDHSLTWEDAEKNCERIGGRLATKWRLQTWTENLVKSLLSKSSQYWVGRSVHPTDVKEREAHVAFMTILGREKDTLTCPTLRGHFPAERQCYFGHPSLCESEIT